MHRTEDRINENADVLWINQRERKKKIKTVRPCRPVWQDFWLVCYVWRLPADWQQKPAVSATVVASRQLLLSPCRLPRRPPSRLPASQPASRSPHCSPYRSLLLLLLSVFECFFGLLRLLVNFIYLLARRLDRRRNDGIKLVEPEIEHIVLRCCCFSRLVFDIVPIFLPNEYATSS